MGSSWVSVLVSVVSTRLDGRSWVHQWLVSCLVNRGFIGGVMVRRTCLECSRGFICGVMVSVSLVDRGVHRGLGL